jgi:hypothetical protein
VPGQKEDLVGYGGGGGGVERVYIVGEALPLGWVAALGEGGVTGIGLVYEAEVGCCLEFIRHQEGEMDEGGIHSQTRWLKWQGHLVRRNQIRSCS